MLTRYSHPDSCYAISRVEETHRACVDSSLWRNPRHDQKKNFDQDEQADCDIPGFKLGPFNPKFATLTSDQIYSNGHSEEEHGFWIILEIDHWTGVSKFATSYKPEARTQLVPRLKASPAGGAMIINTVMAHFNKYGPIGVPNGFVVTQNLGYGSTPCLPISRMTLDWPISTVTRLPNADRMTKMFKPFAAFSPKTAVKNRLAVVVSAVRMSAFGTAAKYATLHSMYKIATRSNETGADLLIVLTGS
jgi:hypothetical protein